MYTAIPRKVVRENAYATTPKGNMGHAQYTVPDTIAVGPTFVAFSFSTCTRTSYYDAGATNKRKF